MNKRKMLLIILMILSITTMAYAYTIYGDLDVKKTIKGNLPVTAVTGNVIVVAANLKGNFYTINSTHTLTFTEAGSIGDSACFYASTAAIFILHPFDDDHFVLDGVDKGHATISSPATAGAFVCILFTHANHWTTIGMKGTFTSP